jgi:hypothetical protein
MPRRTHCESVKGRHFASIQGQKRELALSRLSIEHVRIALP